MKGTCFCPLNTSCVSCISFSCRRSCLLIMSSITSHFTSLHLYYLLCRSHHFTLPLFTSLHYPILLTSHHYTSPHFTSLLFILLISQTSRGSSSPSPRGTTNATIMADKETILNLANKRNLVKSKDI